MKNIQIGNETLIIPDDSSSKCITLFNKHLDGIEFEYKKMEEIHNNYVYSYWIKNTTDKECFKKLDAIKIIDKVFFEQKIDKLILTITVSLYLLSYYKEDITEEFIKTPHWNYCYKSPSKLNDIFLSSNHIPQEITKMDLSQTTFGDGQILQISDFLSENETNELLKYINKKQIGKVPPNGKFNSLQEDEHIGAERGYILSKNISKKLTERVKEILPKVMIIKKENDSIDYVGHKRWELVEVNPLLRIIKYSQYEDKQQQKYGGRLVPHYDYPFDKNREERSLKTLVIYLTNNESGHTRFLKDDLKENKINQTIFTKDYSDWTTMPKTENVLAKIQPKKGQAIIFEHRLLHDAEEIQKDEHKIIIFTDIIYKRV